METILFAIYFARANTNKNQCRESSYQLRSNIYICMLGSSEDLWNRWRRIEHIALNYASRKCLHLKSLDVFASKHIFTWIIVIVVGVVARAMYIVGGRAATWKENKRKEYTLAFTYMNRVSSFFLHSREQQINKIKSTNMNKLDNNESIGNNQNISTSYCCRAKWEANGTAVLFTHIRALIWAYTPILCSIVFNRSIFSRPKKELYQKLDCAHTVDSNMTE